MILIGENTKKLLTTLCNYEKLIFFLCINKMYLIPAEKYKNEKVDFLTIKTTSEVWVSMKDVGSCMGVTNISDLVLKENMVFVKQKILQKNKLMNIK